MELTMKYRRVIIVRSVTSNIFTVRKDAAPTLLGQYISMSAVVPPVTSPCNRFPAKLEAVFFSAPRAISPAPAPFVSASPVFKAALPTASTATTLAFAGSVTSTAAFSTGAASSAAVAVCVIACPIPVLMASVALGSSTPGIFARISSSGRIP